MLDEVQNTWGHVNKLQTLLEIGKRDPNLSKHVERDTEGFPHKYMTPSKIDQVI